MTNFVTGDIDIYDLRVDLDLDGSGLAPDCGLRLTADNTQILGDYTLGPYTPDPQYVDVNLTSGPFISFTGFNDEFYYGLCDFPLIGDLIQLIIGDVQPIVLSGFQEFLDDDDGAGPGDSPLADALEAALADISIAGPVSEALGVTLTSPLAAVNEDVNGVTLDSNSRFNSSVGTNPGQCTPPAGSPDLAASYHIAEAFPSYGPTTPVGGLAYNLALGISTSAFNQLLKAQIECGLLRTSITQVDFGTGLFDLTAGTLYILIPELQSLPEDTPMRLDLLPSLAPLLTGNTGQGVGEIAEIAVPHLVIELYTNDGTNKLKVRGAVDFKSGLGVQFDSLQGVLTFTVGQVATQNITVAIIDNPINTNVTNLQTALPVLLREALPLLGSGLGAFPLPGFLGLSLQGVEVSRQGAFYSLFANLVPTP
jgi:hypothetical protein